MTNSNILQFALSTNYQPATNLQSDAACADWRFLLPQLWMDKILIIGAPSVQTLAVLSRTSREIIVVCEESEQVEDIRKKCAARKIQNVFIKRLQHTAKFPFSDSDFDLIQLVGRIHKSIYIETMMAELHRILKPDAIVYYEISRIDKYLFSRIALKRIQKKNQLSTIGDYWLTPLSKDLRTAVPSNNSKISSYFFSNVLFGQSFKARALSKVGKILSKTGLINYISPRCGIMFQHTATRVATTKLPYYLIELGEQAGMDISRLTFGFSARGKYNSNKVIFFLFDREGSSPVSVIKITRTPEYNFRLENEFNALSLLKENKYLGSDTYPEPFFHGTHNNLAVLCIKAVQGLPFRIRTDGTADCTIANSAMDLILRLGAKSVDKEAASSADIATALKTLYSRFVEIYSLSSEDQKFLSAKIGTLTNQPEQFPLVLQHGDPGTWNMFVTEDNKVILLDWESSEPRGIPLWDLFYFFRTYSSWMSRKDGARDPIRSFTDHFLEPSALGDHLHDYTTRYCALIGLNKAMIEPLFYTCWMHRALKQSTRLSTSDLNSGSYINLLRLVIERKDSAGLRRLFLC